jgi:hypothetical protein
MVGDTLVAMGRQGTPGRWPQWVAAGIVVAAAWALYAVWRSPNRDDYATYGAFAAAVIVIVPAVLAWAQRKSSGSAAVVAELDPAVRDLTQEEQAGKPAGQVGTQIPRPAQSRVSRLMLSAVQNASTLTGADKAFALGAVIGAAVLAAPERVGWLIADAETTARSIEEAPQRWLALAGVAGAVAVADPDRGEAIARSIEDAGYRSDALGRVAAVVAVADPDRGEAIARSIDHAFPRSDALARIAALVAVADPDRGEAMAARSRKRTTGRMR